MPDLTARGDFTPISRSFHAARLPLAYTEWGDPNAPTLILIHGNRDHSRSWDWTARVLATHWRIICPDLRGHGDSGWSQDGHYDFAAYLADLAALVATLGDGPITLVGHSLGAHIALRFAGLYPERVQRLVAIEAVGAPPEIEARRGGLPIDLRMRQWLAEREAADSQSQRRFATVADATARLRARHPSLDADRAAHLTREGLRMVTEPDGDALVWKYDPYLAVWPFPDIAQSDVEALWRRISCPTLLVYGDKSWSSDIPAQLCSAIPHAERIRFAKAGHWPHHDCFEEFMDVLQRFVGGK